MKKITAILLSMVVILSLAACGNSESGSGQPSAGGNSVENKADNDMMPESSSAGNAESGGNSEGQQEGGENIDAQTTKVLVAYFSATNTTKGVAEC